MKGSRIEQKLKHEELFCYLIFLLIGIKYLLPSYLNGLLEQMRILDLLLTLFCIGLIVFFFLWKKTVPKLSILIVALVYLCLLLSTGLNRGNLLNAFLHSVQVLLLCMLVDAVVRTPKAQKPFLRAVRDVTLVFFTVNFFLMYLLPNGIPSISEGKVYPQYLYGNYNAVIRYVLPGLVCSLILDGMRERKRIVPSIPTWILSVGILISAVTVYFTATAVVTDLLLILWALLYRPFRRHAWKLYGLALLLAAIFELVFVVGAKGSGVLTFVATLFHKPVDFHGRIPLWTKMLISIREKPVFGYGLQTYDMFLKLLGNGYGSHNYVLDMLQQRGLVGLLAILALLFVPAMRGIARTEIDRPLYMVIGACCAFTVQLLFEPCYEAEYLFIPLFYLLFDACTRPKAPCFEQSPKQPAGTA